jgi:DNA-binding response OmpR family regulator
MVGGDPILVRTLARVVRTEFDVLFSSSGTRAVKLAQGGGIDLLVIDWRTGDTWGLDVIMSLRARAISLPFVVCDLAAHTLNTDLVSQIARVSGRVHVREASPLSKRDAVALGRLRVDFGTRSVWLRCESGGWAQVKLTRTQTDVVMALADHLGERVTREALIGAVWGAQSDVQDHAVEQVISKVRKGLGPAKNMLATVPGGYRLGPEQRYGRERERERERERQRERERKPAAQPRIAELFATFRSVLGEGALPPSLLHTCEQMITWRSTCCVC